MLEKVIISISTIPPRFGHLGEALHSLLNQKRRADEIHVYVPKEYRRFPEHSFSIPEVPEGVQVKVVETDFGPATKVLPCALAYRGTNTRIIYGDDDRFADTGWLDEILKITAKRPDDAIVSAGMTLANYDLFATKDDFLPRAERKRVKYDFEYLIARARQKIMEVGTGKSLRKPARKHYQQSGYVDFALGLGGVSVQANFFDDICFDIPKVLWAVDDIWLSGNLARQGIGIWASESIRMPVATGAQDLTPLASSIIEGHGRREADLACINYLSEKYGIWN